MEARHQYNAEQILEELGENLPTAHERNVCWTSVGLLETIFESPAMKIILCKYVPGLEDTSSKPSSSMNATTCASNSVRDFGEDEFI